MTSKRLITYLTISMVVVAIIISTTAIGILYQAALDEKRDSLIQAAASQARLLKILVQHGINRGVTKDMLPAILAKINDTHDDYGVLGIVGTHKIIQRVDDKIILHFSHGSANESPPEAVRFLSGTAAIYRKALSGETGASIADNSTGIPVLSAYAPVGLIDLAVIAHIDVAQIRAPFLMAGLYVALATALFTGLAAMILFLPGNPVMRKLRETETRYEEIVEGGKDLVLTVDANGRITYANRIAPVLLGQPIALCLGEKALDYSHPMDRERIKCHLKLAIESKDPMLQIENRLMTRHGDIHHISWNMALHYDKAGALASVNCIGRDLSTEKKVAEALKASQARLEDIVTIAPEAIISVGEDMMIQLFNQSAERIFGYKADEILGQHIEILVPVSLRAIHTEHIHRFNSSNDSYRLMDTRSDLCGLRKDGTRFPASVSISKIGLGSGKFYTVMLRDVTERQQAEENLRNAVLEAEKANSAKTEFLATMSHELRTPLNAIIGFSEILSEQMFGELGAPKYKEYSEDILASGNHLLTLVNDILDLSRIEAGKRSLSPENLSLPQVVGECTPMVDALSRRKGVKFSMQMDNNLPTLFADRRAIQQILINLLTNAIKFTPAGGQAVLKVTADAEYHIFKIADTGRGIHTDRMDDLTKPFERGETNIHMAQEGTGLGLAIVKSLTELHLGSLNIESEIGVGTTVTITLPRAALHKNIPLEQATG